MWDPVASSAQRQQILCYVTVSSVALLVYDYTVTLSEELELVWRSKWNLGKLLFFLTRYLTFVDASLMLVFLFHHGMSEEACRITFSVALFIITAGTFVAQVIVGMRVYALYGRPRYVLILQASSIVINLVLVCVVQIDTERHLEWSSTTVNGEAIACFVTEKTRDFSFIEYGALLASEFIFMVLALWKGISQWRQSIRSSNLIFIFHRDGVLAFVCLFTLTAANFVLPFHVNDYRLLLLELQRVLHSVITARMILNMRGASRLLEHREDSALTLSRMEFANDQVEELDN